VSYRRDVGNYTVPYVIRNLRPRRWPTMVMRICIVGSLVSCAVAIVLLKHRAPLEFAIVLMFSALLAVGGAFSIACFLLMNRSIDKVLLGEVLETRPKIARYGIDDIQRIEFVSSPEEDYREMDRLAPVRDARIVLRRIQGFRSISLLLSSADASRLREWAKQNGIQVAAGEIDV